MTKTKTQKQRANAQKSAQPKKTMVKKVSQSQPRKGLSMKMSRSSFNYLVSSLFPFAQTARIPDVCQLSTTVFQLTYDFSLSLSSSGIGGAYFGLNNWLRFTAENATTTTDSSLTFNATVDVQNTAIQSSFSAMRPVSASVHIYSTNSDLNNSGRIVGYTLACNNTAQLEALPASFNGIISLRDNWGLPAKEGIFIRYKPTDLTADIFSATTGSGFTRGFLGFHISGAATNAIFVGRCVVNYECISNTDVLSYQTAEPSIHDDTGYNIVKGIMSRVSSFSDYQSVESMLSAGGTLMAGTRPGRALDLARQLVRAYGAAIEGY